MIKQLLLGTAIAAIGCAEQPDTEYSPTSDRYALERGDELYYSEKSVTARGTFTIGKVQRADGSLYQVVQDARGKVVPEAEANGPPPGPLGPQLEGKLAGLVASRAMVAVEIGLREQPKTETLREVGFVGGGLTRASTVRLR